MNMEKEVLETVLMELDEESKKINLQVEDQNKELQELKAIISDFNKKLTEIKVTAPKLDTLPLTMILEEGINSIKKKWNLSRSRFSTKNGFCFSRSGIKKNIIRSSLEEFYSGYSGLLSLPIVIFFAGISWPRTNRFILLKICSGIPRWLLRKLL
jgi:hypothetical protein